MFIKLINDEYEYAKKFFADEIYWKNMSIIVFVPYIMSVLFFSIITL